MSDKCYVLQVLTGDELPVRDRLKELGVVAHVPQESRLIRSGGRWINRDYVLFTSYVFVWLDFKAADYYRLKAVPGILRFLELNGGSPTALTERETEYISALSPSDDPLRPSAVMLVGCTRRIVPMAGPLKQYADAGIPIRYHMHKRRAEVYLPFPIFGKKKRLLLSFKVL